MEIADEVKKEILNNENIMLKHKIDSSKFSSIIIQKKEEVSNKKSVKIKTILQTKINTNILNKELSNSNINLMIQKAFSVVPSSINN